MCGFTSAKGYLFVNEFFFLSDVTGSHFPYNSI